MYDVLQNYKSNYIKGMLSGKLMIKSSLDSMVAPLLKITRNYTALLIYSLIRHLPIICYLFSKRKKNLIWNFKVWLTDAVEKDLSRN